MIWLSDALPGPKWRFWDGAALSRAEYSLLFSRIGTQHGAGDGSTTFNLPNEAGKVLVGLDAADTDFDTLGETGGTKAATMPTHGHGLGTLDVSPSSVVVSGGGSFGYTVAASDPGAANPVDSVSTSVGGAVADASGSGNNMPPYIVVRHIIKVR